MFIGAAPLTDWLDGVVVRDSAGFVVAGPDLSADGERPLGWELDRMPYHLETSVPGVFVASDIGRTTYGIGQTTDTKTCVTLSLATL